MDEEGTSSGEEPLSTSSVYTPPHDVGGSTIEEVLRMHHLSIGFDLHSDETTMIAIRRRRAWEDTKKYMKKGKCITAPVQVKFVGEMGIDTGGPRRAYFTVATRGALDDGSLFGGPKTNKVPVHNGNSVLNRGFFYAGQLFAMSIMQGGMGPSSFAPWVYEYLCRGLSGHYTSKDFTDEEHVSVMQEVCFSNR